MHELSIAQALIDAATKEAANVGATRVTKLACRVGCLRQVDATLLTDAFELARAGSIAADAELVVTSVGMHLDCASCSHAVDLDTWRFECPRCQARDIKLSGGDELELTSLELEVPDGD